MRCADFKEIPLATLVERYLFGSLRQKLEMLVEGTLEGEYADYDRCGHERWEFIDRVMAEDTLRTSLCAGCRDGPPAAGHTETLAEYRPEGLLQLLFDQCTEH